MRTKFLLAISIFTGVLPIIVGSVIFWAWYLEPKMALMKVGFVMILVSIPFCITGLILLIVLRLKNKHDFVLKKRINSTMLLILSNIPICVAYFSVAMYVEDVDRITIINSTEGEISNIQIFGTGDYDYIERIEQEGSETIWVQLRKEGDVKMYYDTNNQLESRTLDGYTGPGSGKRFDYRLFSSIKD